MNGKEPEIFTGDRDKVEEFMTSWSVYHRINKQTRVMNNPMSRTMLFFGYLRGPKCYVTAGTFARRGLSSTAKTLRSLVWCSRVLEY